MASKPATAKAAAKTAAKAQTRPEAAAPAESQGGAPDEAKVVGVKLKELMDRVVETSGVKRKEVKPVVEAMLAEMSKALEKGELLILPGMGKLRVVRGAGEAGGTMTLKLRKMVPGEAKAKTDTEALAAESE